MHSSRFFIVVCAAALVLAAGAAAAATPVVSEEYENLDPEHGLANVPVTFSRIGAAGDFTRGVTPVVDGAKLPAQVDVLRKADDGSIRHALVSFVLPTLPAGGKVKIDWLDQQPAAPAAFDWKFDQGKTDLKLELSREDGAVVTSDLGKLLGSDWAKAKGVVALCDGPVMKEFEIHNVPVDAQGRADKEFDVYWRLRAFSGQKSVRVEAVVERTKPRAAGDKRVDVIRMAGVKLMSGVKALFEQGAYRHIDQTRYRILVWTDGAMENIHRRPNYEYWVKGKFVPQYRWTTTHPAADVDKTYLAKTQNRNDQTRAQGILEPGIIYDSMPDVAGRWDIGPYPAWSVAYLLSGAPGTYGAILHADGNGAGAFYIHVRQDGLPGYNVFTVKQPPLDQGFRIDLYKLSDGQANTLRPDHAHAPSLGYVAYLLTGDKFYAEEMSFWASYQMGEWPHKGLSWQQMDRAFAWSTRHVVDAAFILPDGHPLREYFAKGVADAMAQITEKYVKSGLRVHAPVSGSNWRSSGRMAWINATQCSAWMYAWVVWSLGNASDKGCAGAEAVRQWAAEYIIGFYTSKDEFKAPDGKTYTYDPRDAMPYATAVSLWEYKIVADDQGRNRTEQVKKIKDLDNYGEIWYWTKVNEDNAYGLDKGLQREPGPDGQWQFRADGWGHGMYNWGTQKTWWNWHRYGAWVGMVSAVEGKAPKAKEAWKVMTELAGPKGDYDFEMVPRAGLP